MSIPVDLAALGEALGRHDVAYLLTSGDVRPHVAQVELHLDAGAVVVAEPGRTARRVVGERPAVTLLLPPREPDGHTLLVDGTGELDDDGALRITPSHAVLHRAAFVGR
ncbi:hypothetical protein GCM10009584_26740 [Ornithinimicrobium humiphilum]|jgi:hypothetical protein|uniref:Pyridoxamine 5'-phosphate oxidase n=1 Tax=Ornithinimicrobium humiphilum TaxID=125288 RepID=A0A543KPB3_9MICO|nr:pyridoxamine 5'-phosphate oxidase family protein [Ornithinimicrobium humiphilum]TQM96907.1 hypothetical protein FB476_1800 [Ornithinimicrobium humiphilum]